MLIRNVTKERLLFILDNLNTFTEVRKPVIVDNHLNNICIIKMQIGIIQYQLNMVTKPLETINCENIYNILESKMTLKRKK